MSSTPTAHGAVPIDGNVKLAMLILGLAISVLLAELAGIMAAALMAGVTVPRLSGAQLIAILLLQDVETVTGIARATVPYWVAFTATWVLLGAVGVWAWRSFARNANPLLNPERLPGFPHARVVEAIAGRKALLKQKHLRPDLVKPTVEQLGFKLGTYRGTEVWMSIEDTLLIIGPPRSGKGTNFVIPLLHTAPGALITTSVRPDNVKLAMRQRERMGSRAHVFDPAALVSGIGKAAKWDPLVGCESDEVVRRRVAAMMPADTFSNTKSGDYWASASQMIIGTLMHAAALPEEGRRKSMRDVWRWLSDQNAAREAVQILEAHPAAAPGWGSALSALLSAPAESRANKWDAAVTSVNFLSYARVQEMLCPEPGEGFNPWIFLEQKESLFLLGTVSGDTTMNRLAVMLFDEISNTALELAAIAPGERLSPPAWFVLDEAANFAIPTLPKILSYFSGSGLVLIPIFQDISQARAAYGADEADAIMANCLVKVFLPGRTKARDLEEIEKLIGQHKVTQASRSLTSGESRTSLQYSMHDESIITAAQIAGMTRGWATVLFRETAFAMRLLPYTQQKWAKDLYADRAAVNADVLTVKAEQIAERRAAYDR
jgi:type IV secretory pathway TraG/TraD family ATPase VirD4